MSNIVINTDDQTPNYDAVETVSKFIMLNRTQKVYCYNREITSLSGRVLIVRERHNDSDKYDCDCSFQVTRKK